MKTTLISLFMLLLIVSLAAVTQSVDFNNTSDLNTYFNNPNLVDVVNVSNGGIGGSGSVQTPYLWGSFYESRVMTYKTGFHISQIGEPITVSAYINSAQNGGFAGIGFSSASTNTASGSSLTYGSRIDNVPAMGMCFWSSACTFFNNQTQQVISNYSYDIDLTWFKAVFTIIPQSSTTYSVSYKLYQTTSSGVVGGTPTKSGSTTFTNSTLDDGLIYPFFYISGHRVPNVDNFYYSAPDGPVITPTVETNPVVLSGGASLPVTNDVAGAYLCNYSGTSDLMVPILANQRGFAYYDKGTGSQWYEGDYVLLSGYSTWENVPFGAKGDIPVVIVDPDATLPVTMSSFTATLSSQTQVNLQWITESESNILGFNVYRSVDSHIAHAIKLNIGLIEGTNTSSQHSYNFSDSEFEPSSIYYYWVESAEMDNNSNFYGPVSVFTGGGGEVVPPPAVEDETGIVNAFPNPFSPCTDIIYNLKDAANVTLSIYNQKGQLIRSLVNSNKDSGNYKIGWDGNDSKGNPCASGLYIARMQAGSVNSYYKMTLVK